MLDNLASHIENTIEETGRIILIELNKLRYYRPQGRPSYSNEILKFSLLQCYTSRQAYSMLLEEFPLPSLSYLKSLSKGGIEPTKSLNLMLESGNISSDYVLLLDEIYLQKGVQYHGGSLIGIDEEGELYTGVVTFIVVGLNKKSIPFVIKACPERKICGHWLAEEIEESLKTLGSISLFVRAIISDNHASNVLAFKNLRRKFGNIEDKACLYFDGKKFIIFI